jgi:hypothetical protein
MITQQEMLGIETSRRNKIQHSQKYAFPRGEQQKLIFFSKVTIPHNGTLVHLLTDIAKTSLSSPKHIHIFMDIRYKINLKKGAVYVKNFSSPAKSNYSLKSACKKILFFLCVDTQNTGTHQLNQRTRGTAMGDIDQLGELVHCYAFILVKKIEHSPF